MPLKKVLFSLALSCLAWHVHAGQRALTDNGAIVILEDDGTWRYESGPATDKAAEIPVNKATFRRLAEQSFAVKSQKNRSAVWIDPKKWTFRKPEPGTGPAEYRFQFKGGDMYGMLITEQIEVPLETLVQVAFDNARQFAPNARIVSREYRVVNGLKVVNMRIDAFAQGINFTYLGNYISDKSGSTQFIVYTATNLIEQNRAEAEAFLNGLIAQD